MTIHRMSPVAQRYAGFARKDIAPRKDLHDLTDIPMDLWQKMATQGLFSLVFPSEFDGAGKDALDLSQATQALAMEGKNMGMVASWLIPQIIGRFIFMRLGSREQHERYLPSLAHGKTIPCLAISEPSGGAHPARMNTTANQKGDYYILNGEKTMLTNAPIADLFLVIAITKESGDRREFTAFIIDRDTPGLSLTKKTMLDFLRPSVHGGIILKDCKVTDKNILGKKGQAYTDIVRPFRGIEDTFIASALAGALKAHARALVRMIKDQIPSPHNNSLCIETSEITAMAHSMGILAENAATMLEAREMTKDHSLVMITLRDMGVHSLEKVTGIIKEYNLDTDISWDQAHKDLVMASQFAKKTNDLMKIKIAHADIAHCVP
ncbi:MAG: acyl-CoA dehydrogenase family protein [Thermodesulfobacteriota bacterium]|nr:acyl-CoA dehydrogenase family protein [Thermodesulfobacteriota bacterium]